MMLACLLALLLDLDTFENISDTIPHISHQLLLQVPADETIAVRLMAQQESEAAERSQIKALVLEANQREQDEEAAAAAAARADAAANRKGYRGGRSRGYGGSGGPYRYQTPGGGGGGGKATQPGPQLTLRGHVHQLTGEKAEDRYPG